MTGNKKRTPWNKGVSASEELIRKNSEGHKGLQSGEKNPFYGKHHSDETRIKMKQNHWSEKNPNWLGGKSFEPYCPQFNKEFKSVIKLRENFCCLNCGISEQTHIVLKGKRMTVHHIDYDKKNTCLQNCCTLCNACNIKANINRIEWTDFFQDKLTKRYGYQYPKLEEEVLLQIK